MKKSLLVFLIIISYSGISISSGNSRIETDDQWSVVQTGTFCLKSVHFVNDDEGWVAGGPALLKTRNSGASWEPKLLEETEPFLNLNYVCFYNRNLGIVTADDGLVFITANSGKNWVKSDTGLGYPIFSGLFIDADTIIVAGGTRYGSGGGIAMSVDYGITWETILSCTTTFLTSIHLPNGNVVFGGSKGAIVEFFTESGLLNTLKVPTEGWISSIDVEEGLMTVVTQKGGLFTSVDGCETWTGIEFQEIQFFDAFFDNNRMLVTGYDFYQRKGVLYRIMDDRTSLEELYKRPLTEIMALDVTPNGNVWLVGYSGMILKSTGNYNFVEVSTIDNVLNDIEANDKGIWAVGRQILPENEAYPGYRADNGIILHSVNGSEWEVVCRFYGTDIKSIDYHDDKWFAVGSNGVFLLSENGFDWDFSNHLRTSSNLNRILFTSKKVGGILGDNGFFSLTVDGGETWNRIELECLENWNAKDFVMLTNESVIFTGMNYLKLTSWNININGSTRVTQLFVDFKGIMSVNNSYIYAIGDHGAVLYSKNVGNNWIKIENLPDVDMLDIARSDTEIIIVGKIGTIVQLSISGEIISVTSGTRINTFNCITYNNVGEIGTWWAAGSIGLIMKKEVESDLNEYMTSSEEETSTVFFHVPLLSLMILYPIAIRKKREHRG